MYLFTIGKQGVTLAEELFKCDEDLKKENGLKKLIEKELLSGVTGVLSTTDFMKLPVKENINDEILLNEQALRASDKDIEIKGKSLLLKLELPIIDKNKLESILLGTGIGHAINNAADLTRKYIVNKLDHNGEKWIEYGMNKIVDETCPFCNQDIQGLEIINAFKTYFSEEYKKTIRTIDAMEVGFTQKFSNDVIFNFQKNIATNIELLTFWKQYVIIDDTMSLAFDEVISVWNELTAEIKLAINTKKMSPLEELLISEELNSIIDGYLAALEKLKDYNDKIDRTNQKIEERKATINHLKAQDIKSRLNYLMNTKLRHSDEKKAIIDKYQSQELLIKKIENHKKKLRAQLDTYTRDIFAKYEVRINHHLKNCGASFKISDYKSSFQGGKPSSNFSLLINNVEVNLGNEKSPLTTPTFSNTLSEGDKSSLAFAFFLAKLESDTEIDKKVVIFDDPISSLDNHRKSHTADQVMKFSQMAKQVIVLTHDTFFARVLWGKFADKRTLLTQLCIRRDGIQDSTIDIWDIEEATKSDYYQSFFTLADFLEGKANMNYRAVAMCIRPLLEGNLRIRFPRHFKSTEWLGGFIEKVRSATEEPLIQMQFQLSELEEINDYSKKFHHDQNPFADSEPINDAELMTYVERTLQAVRGLHNAVV
ncbi:AAA family ATPase [Paenibacillus sp. MMO-177]|uniref:AAA family ATPase n=1 Tax=Paenibacillus sp. MMO-177 TaxID=3081289 RepID=UPI00301AE669